jgi:hypothetical protein
MYYSCNIIQNKKIRTWAVCEDKEIHVELKKEKAGQLCLSWRLGTGECFVRQISGYLKEPDPFRIKDLYLHLNRRWRQSWLWLLAFDVIILASAHAYYSHWFNDYESATFCPSRLMLETVMNLLILLEHNIVSPAFFLNEFSSVNKSEKDVALPRN